MGVWQPSGSVGPSPQSDETHCGTQRPSMRTNTLLAKSDLGKVLYMLLQPDTGSATMPTVCSYFVRSSLETLGYVAVQLFLMQYLNSHVITASLLCLISTHEHTHDVLDCIKYTSTSVVANSGPRAVHTIFIAST